MCYFLLHSLGKGENRAIYDFHKFISFGGLVGRFSDRGPKHLKPALGDKV